MANLGALYSRVANSQRTAPLGPPVGFDRNVSRNVVRMPPVPRGGARTLTGTVKNGSVLVPGARVDLYDSVSGQQLRKTVSDSVGAFTFTSLADRTEGYFAVAFDPSGLQNAVIFDRLTPI